MSRSGPIEEESGESGVQGDARGNSDRLKEVIVGAVANEVAHVVDFSKMPPRDPDEVVDITTPFLEEVPLNVENPEYPFTDD